jgi:hypothetical protein
MPKKQTTPRGNAGPAKGPAKGKAAGDANPKTVGKTKSPASRTAKEPSVEGGAAVDALLAASPHPLAAEIAVVRKAIVAAGEGVEELVMWNAPSFRRGTEVFATIHVRERKHVLVVLHRGAKPGAKPAAPPPLPDPLGLVEVKDASRVLVRLPAGAAFAAAAKSFRALARAWLAGG